MGFPAQGEKGQKSAAEHGAGVFVGVDLLAFVDNNGPSLFAVEGEGAPGAVAQLSTLTTRPCLSCWLR